MSSSSDSEDDDMGMQFQGSARVAYKKNKEALETLEKKKKARQLAIPTNDKLVKARLRELGEPIILFGELPENRRDRLRNILVEKGIDQGMPASATPSIVNQPVDIKENELFYSEGSSNLKQARLWIARNSLHKARERIKKDKYLYEEQQKLIKQQESEMQKAMEIEQEETEKQRLEKNEFLPDLPSITETSVPSYIKLDDPNAEIINSFKYFSNQTSEIGDERPLSSCCISPNDKLLITGSWSGSCNLWDINSSKKIQNYQGHSERTTCVKFHPESTISSSESSLNIASCAADKTVKLWSLDKTEPIATLKGHEDRVNRIAFHPSGKYLASTSFDKSWFLWDLETQTLLLDQEGHYLAPYGIAIHPDGSLLTSGGCDSIARVWDLRSGKSILVLKGHVKQILSVDFSPNGYQLITGSEDHTVRVWDLRKKRTIYTILAHSNIISSLTYEKTNGSYILTSSFDGTSKIFQTSDYKCVKTLLGHDGKVMSSDVSSNSDTIVTAAFDRTWKTYKHNQMDFLEDENL